MKKVFSKIFASLLVLSFWVNLSFAATKERYNLVLFYADWNVYSDKAISTLQDVANISDKISFEKINMDDKKAFVRMKQLGVMPTNAIPYYFLIDKNKDVLHGATYKNESAKAILAILNKNVPILALINESFKDFEFECLDKIKQGNTYDLILMDIMMPNMNGEECIKNLKSIEAFNTPVIALTADAVAGAKERYINLGFVDYVAKPFSKEQIKEKLDKIFVKNQEQVKKINWDDIPKYEITNEVK